jgi:hypothetical protein
VKGLKIQNQGGVMKFLVLLLATSFVSWAHADEVRCSIAVSDQDLMRIQYQVDETGAATSKAQYQFFSMNGFVAQQLFDVSTSEIVSKDGLIRLSAGGEGNTINFEVKIKGGMDAYLGIANGVLKGESFQRLIVCSLTKEQTK